MSNAADAEALAIDPEDTLEALLVRHRTSTQSLHLAFLLLLVSALITVVSLRMDITIRTTGILVSSIERQTLRSLSDGVVHRVFVSAGAHVSAGDTVVALASSASDRARDATRATLVRQRMQQADLRVLIRTQLDSPISMPEPRRFHVEHSRTAMEAALLEWQQASVQVRRVERTRDRLAELARRGFAAASELESAEFDVLRAQEDRTLAFKRRRAAWTDELIEADQHVDNLERDLITRASDQALRHVIAPVGGTVEAVMALSRGSTVRAGDAVAMISPEGDLVADVFVPPHDVVFLRVGMPARLLVEGYDVQEWGVLDAVVTLVAGDYTLDDGHPVFRVRVRPISTMLRRANGETARVKKGLKCQVRFTLGSERLAQLLKGRTRTWIDQ